MPSKKGINKKAKGSRAERDLLDRFWNENWAGLRAAGSGSTKHPCPDILVGNGIRRLAIECKVINDSKKYFELREVEELSEFSKLFGAESWIAIQFEGSEWYFIMLEDLKETKRSLKITTEMVKMKGLTFNEVIGKI